MFAFQRDWGKQGVISDAIVARAGSGHRLGVDPPDVLTVALSSPAHSVMEVLTGEGLGDLDLAAVAVLAVPLWALPADQRSTVAALCQGQLAPVRVHRRSRGIFI